MSKTARIPLQCWNLEQNSLGKFNVNAPGFKVAQIISSRLE